MQIPENDSLPRFWLLFAVQRKLQRASHRGGQNVAKDNALPARIGDRQWREKKAKTRRWTNRTCCFPFTWKKFSSRLNSIISLRGNCEQSLIEIYYSPVYFRRISGSLDLVRKLRRIVEKKRFDVADKLSSLRHWPRHFSVVQFFIFLSLISYEIAGVSGLLVIDGE